MSRQVAATEAQSRVEFARDQRVTLYAAVLADNIAAANAERALLALLDAPTVERAGIRSAERELAGAIDRLREDMFALDLIGSARVAKSGYRLYRVHEDYRSKVSDKAAEVSSQRSEQNLVVGIGAQYNEKIVPSLAKEVAAFTASAKADLELPAD
jgi:hypothetical protein